MKLNQSLKSAKTIAHEEYSSTMKKIDNLKLIAMQTAPQATDLVCSELHNLAFSLEDKINNNYTKETGYTLREISYMTVRGLKLMCAYEQAVLSGSEQKKKTAKDDMKAWLLRQSDEIYNGFMCLRTVGVVNSLYSETMTSLNGGINVCTTLLRRISIIKEFYSGASGAVSKTSATATDVSLGSDESLQTLLKNKTTVTGGVVNDYSTKHLTQSGAEILAVLDSVASLIPIISKLISNYNENKTQLRNASAQRMGSIVKDNAIASGLDSSAIVYIDASSGDMVTDDPSSGLDYAETVLSVPCSSVAYWSDKSFIDSEIDRVRQKLTVAAKDASYDPARPLVSISTATDGGRMKNLKYAGNCKADLVMAINQINGGRKL